MIKKLNGEENKLIINKNKFNKNEFIEIKNQNLNNLFIWYEKRTE